MFDLLLVPASGAVIGIVTNWIAIKMLFRPHTAKRLFEVTLPFTPGVIPKRRADLARKMGQAVGQHILTTDVIEAALKSPENSEQLRNHIELTLDVFIADARSSRLTVAEFAREKLPGGETAIHHSAEHVEAALRALLKSPSLRSEIARLLHEQIIAYINSGTLERKLSQFLEGGFATPGTTHPHYQHLKNLFHDQAHNLLNNNTPIAHYLGEDLSSAQTMLSSAISKHIPPLLISLFSNNPELDERLEDMTQQVIDDNLGGMAKMFVNPAKVYASIKEHVLTTLADETEMQRLSDSAAEKAMIWLQRPVGSVATVVQEYMPLLQSGADSFAKHMSGTLSEKVQGLNIAELVQSQFPAYREDLRAYLDAFTEKLTDTLADYTAGYLQNRKHALLQAEVSTSMQKLQEDDITKFKRAALDLAEKVPAVIAPYVVKSFDVGKLVEDRINCFDVAEIEELTLGVVRRELGIVVALGGVLGFIIGLAVVLGANIF
ncbi:MAG: DUF445 family protein [Defluviitaleaceae bacterium]|nr:DUF445 family protein [Defluviitaleaceae bacterium]